MAEPEVIAPWGEPIVGLEHSPLDFYATLETDIKLLEIPKAELSRVSFKEAGLLSADRQYLRVKRYEHTFDICGAPFGRGFFVSWWLFGQQGCLASLPYLGALLRPTTYYSIDTGLMFQAAVEHAVHQALQTTMETKGLRALSAEDRKPLMRDFFRR